MSTKDHTGEVLHGIKILERYPRPGHKNGAAYKVECLSCHRVYTTSYLYIKRSTTDYCHSCKVRKSNRQRMHDITGKRYGSLVALHYTKSIKLSTGSTSVYWLFKCDCGNEVELEAHAVKRRQKCCSMSCPYNPAKINGKPKGFIPLQEDVHKHKTNIQFKDYTKPPSNNKSGYPGVWFDKKTNKYQAYITFKKKRYYLGYYSDIDEAISIRKNAEQQIFGEFISWYNKLKEEQRNENDSYN